MLLNSLIDESFHNTSFFKDDNSTKENIIYKNNKYEFNIKLKNNHIDVVVPLSYCDYRTSFTDCYKAIEFLNLHINNMK